MKSAKMISQTRYFIDIDFTDRRLVVTAVSSKTSFEVAPAQLKTEQLQQLQLRFVMYTCTIHFI